MKKYSEGKISIYKAVVPSGYTYFRIRRHDRKVKSSYWTKPCQAN